MQKRSHKVIIRPGLLCPSASGDFEFTDVPGHVSLESMHKLREAYEELNIEPENIKDNQTYFLGITRELIRGGKPEIFCFANTNLSMQEFVNNRNGTNNRNGAPDAWESERLKCFDFEKFAFKQLDDEKDRFAFSSRFDKLINMHSENFSIPLWTNLALWYKYRLNS